ncbi:MAG: biopolymer transporter ExbD [Gemmatimonadota bacterium]|nr:biopolymer transporter ExbD [Gemmatimonadota bacterium]MDE3215482.1 biopolymer transporter ExbD [Gemmatimonadota bacterium]
MAISASSSGVQSTPNVTPMIDVMLVLLIIFMVVTPALLAGFNATPPEAQNIKDHPEDSNTDQVLGIDVDGNYYFNKKLIKYEDIAPTLNAVYNAPDRDDKVLYIKADKNLDYGKVLDVEDIAAKNGVVVVALIGDQKPNTVSTVPGDSKDAPPAPGGGN